LDCEATPPIGDDNVHANLDAHSSSSQQAPDAAHDQQMRVEWAAIHIQTAFRGFLVNFVLNVS